MPSSVAVVAAAAAAPESNPTPAPASAGNGVIDALQESVRLHWAAIHHYAILATHFARWGYPKLAAEFEADTKEEHEHLDRLLERLEFYDVAPKFYPTAQEDLPRHDLPAILEANLKLERTAAAVEEAGIKRAREKADEITALAFSENLKGSVDAIQTITAAQRVIGQIGLDNFLADKL